MSWKQLYFSKTKWGPAIVRPPSDSHWGSRTNEDITAQPSERCWIMYELSLDALGSWASLPDIVSAGVIRLAWTWELRCDQPGQTLGQRRATGVFLSQSLAADASPFEPSPDPGDGTGEGRDSTDECVSATPLMSSSVIPHTIDWPAPWTLCG